MLYKYIILISIFIVNACNNKIDLLKKEAAISKTLYYLGKTFFDLKQNDMATNYFSQALAMQKKLLNENHQDIQQTMDYLAQLKP